MVFFRVDFDHCAVPRDRFEIFPDFLPVPWLFRNVGLASGGIVDDLVGMSHEVESSGRDHPHQFVEIVRNQLAQVVAEMKAQVFCKRLRVGVYIDIFPTGLDQVHRSDPVVQRQFLKVVRSRVALFVQVVDFESGVQFDPIRVCGFQPVDFRKVGRHPFRFQRPAGRERERCVRRDSVSGESLPHGLLDEILHRSFPVAERAMAVVVGAVVRSVGSHVRVTVFV